MASIMSEEESQEDLIDSVAQAVILLAPIADLNHEYTAGDIAERLNPDRISRRRPIVAYESLLEAGLNESRIRRSLEKLFPMQLEFNRCSIRNGLIYTNSYKIKFLASLSVGHLSIDSLAAAIKENIGIKKRKRYRYC